MTNSFKSFIKLLMPKYQKLILEYKIDMKPRYGYGLKPHTLLYELINKNRNIYEQFLKEILIHKNTFHSIRSIEVEKDENQQHGIMVFAWVRHNFIIYYALSFKPQKYIEIVEILLKLQGSL